MLTTVLLAFLLINRTNSQSPSVSIVSELIKHPDINTHGHELHLGDDGKFIRSDNELLPVESASAPNTSDNSTLSKDRQKRFIYKNVYGTFDFGFQIVIPYIIILPPFSNFFNKWRNKRSTPGGNTLQNESQGATYFEDDPFIQQYLDRINSYFELIQIFEPACRQRAVCEFSADPSRYFPIAELVLTNLRSVPNDYFEFVQNSKNSTTEGPKPESLFKLYSAAEEHGLVHGHQHCHTKFAEQCFYSTDQRLDMSTLKFWKLLESLIGLKVEQKE